jgi:flagellar FliL protein
MAEVTAAEEPAAPRRKSKLPLILGLVLALAGGGGGFYAVQSGLILGSHEEAAEPGPQAPPMPDVAFVAVEPMVINLGEEGAGRHLRFSAQLEVGGGYSAEVATLMPRVVDVLNSYLRAVDIAEIEDRSALVRLRAQMLRRVQLVVGEGRVRDLLISEFVVN